MKEYNRKTVGERQSSKNYYLGKERERETRE